MKKFIPFIIIFALILFFYHPILTTYFSQDDFLHFKISQTDGSLNELINLFGFHPFNERGVAFYRPIFREVLYNIFYSIFGLNQLPFRILQLTIHFINVWLVYLLMQKIFQKREISIFVAFFFGIGASNLALLYYLANGIQILGATMFTLLTLIFFINFLQKKHLKYVIFSFITFLLGLGSHELTTVIPILLLGLIIIYSKDGKTLKIGYLLPFFLTLIIYLYLNITKIGFSSPEQQYQAIFNIKTLINSYVWYYGWALGLPEMLIDFVLPNLKLNPDLLRYWGSYYIIIFPTFILSILILTISAIYLFFKKNDVFLDKRFWFLFFWFPIGLLPVIFLPSHKSTYYLAPSITAFWAIVGFLIFSTFQNIKKRSPQLANSLISIFAGSLLFLQIISLTLGHTTYWAATRGKLAEILINEIKTKYPTLPEGSALYLTNDPNYPYVAKDWGGTSKQASLALNGQDAIQLLYKDPTLKVFYEDLGGIPQNFPLDKVYTVVAKF